MRSGDAQIGPCVVLDPGPTSPLSGVDRAILDEAFGDWRGGTLADAVSRLRDATERNIPAGRVYLLGRTPHGPVVGSLVSGTALTEDAIGLAIVRVDPGSPPDTEHPVLRPLARLRRCESAPMRERR